MLQYSFEEAFLQLWKIKLMQFNKSKEQEELLAIINSKAPTRERFRDFNALRNHILLSEEQSWSFFSWLWSILTCCFSDPEPELSLEDLLSQVVEPTKFKLLSAEKFGAGRDVRALLKDSAYETALFNNPEKAFLDLQSHIKLLPQSGVNRVLERLNAIKYHLEPHCYQNILSDLYKKFPLETLSAQYGEFCKNPHKFQGTHEFIENELISRELMKLFISRPDKEPITPLCYDIQELELILLLSYSENPPLQTMLQKAITAKTDPLKCYQLFPDLFRQAKAQIIAMLPEYIRDAHEAQKAANKEKNISALDDQITLMKTALRYSSDIFEINSLHQHLAKLACQELLTHYHQLPGQQKDYQLHKTIKFLSRDLLNTWSTAQVVRSQTWNLKFTAGECEAYVNYSDVDELYKNAVFFANRIAFALLLNESSLEQIIAEFPHTFLAKQTKLAPHELTWILSVVEMVRPNEPQTLKKVEKLLIDLGSSPKEKEAKRFERKHSEVRLSTNQNGFHQPKVRTLAQDPAPRKLAFGQ